MSQSLAAAGTTAGAMAELALTGDLTRPARLTVSDRLAWPQHRVRVSFEWATSGVQHHGFEGPLRVGLVVARSEPRSVLAEALLTVAREAGVRDALDDLLHTYLGGGHG
ncbi:hypothetical protein [Streptomyces avermitilis]|uniref:hypothetical protein n=1 Tax=Streptomyces avermitilis TaxID=33903 RepID=UPI003F4CE1C3